MRTYTQAKAANYNVLVWSEVRMLGRVGRRGQCSGFCSGTSLCTVCAATEAYEAWRLVRAARRGGRRRL